MLVRELAERTAQPSFSHLPDAGDYREAIYVTRDQSTLR